VLCGLPPDTVIGAGTNVFAMLNSAVDVVDATEAIML
jgi:hypothetical protein